ncbi:MAG: type III-B CRISPR module-associated protein Cmr5 [Desulfurococcaceae archaeon]
MDEELLIKSVLECINHITSKYGPSSDIAKKVRARARSMPEYSFTRGLVYTLVFVASKSSKDLVEIGLKEQRCEDVINKIEESKASSEEKSYAIYGAILLHIARKLNIVKEDKFEEAVRDLRSPATEVKMWYVLDWLKRFAEAYIYE